MTMRCEHRQPAAPVTSELVNGGAAPRDGGGPCGPLLPESNCSPSYASITNVILLIERCMDAQRAAATDRRDVAENSQAKKEAQVVRAMREEADDVFKKALVSGVTSIAAGAIQMAGAGFGAHAAKLEADAAEMQKTAQRLGHLSERAAAISSNANVVATEGRKVAATGGVVAAGGRMVEGSGKIAEGGVEAEVKADQCEQAEHRAAADSFGRQVRRDDERAREVDDLRKKILERMEQLLQSNQQTRMALIQRAV